MISFDTVTRLEHGGGPMNLATVPYEEGRVPPSVFPGEQLPEWDPGKAVREGYQNCSVLAQVVTDLAEKCASVPWHWWELGTGPDGTDEMGDPVTFLENPDPEDKVIPGSGTRDRATQHEEEVVDLLLSGHSYTGIDWEGGKALRLKPRRMKVEDPDGVYPFTDDMDRLVAFQWADSSNGGYRYWESRDIVQVKWRPNPQNRHLGFTLLWPLASEVDTYVDLTKLQLNRIRGGAAAGGIYRDTAIVDETNRALVEKTLNKNISKKAGAWMVVGGSPSGEPGEISVHSAPILNARQLQLLETLSYLRDRIWSCYGPHPALISSDASTLDNLKVANLSVWQRAVLINSRYANAYTTRFVADKDRGKLAIFPDYSGVEALQETDAKINRLSTLVKDCGVATDEGVGFLRMRLGPQPGGDQVLVPGNLIPKADAGLNLDG